MLMWFSRMTQSSHFFYKTMYVNSGYCYTGQGRNYSCAFAGKCVGFQVKYCPFGNAYRAYPRVSDESWRRVLNVYFIICMFTLLSSNSVFIQRLQSTEDCWIMAIAEDRSRHTAADLDIARIAIRWRSDPLLACSFILVLIRMWMNDQFHFP